MGSREVWFSHRENVYRIKGSRIEWTEQKKIWSWDRCTISFARSPKKRLRVVVRSNTIRNHTRPDVNRPMTLRFILGFDINKVHKIYSQSINPSLRSVDCEDRWNVPGERWIFRLDSDYWIWDWKADGEYMESSNVYQIYREIKTHLASPEPIAASQLFDLKPKSISDKMVLDHIKYPDRRIIHLHKRIIPVIYQPSADGLKNFIREVHCAQKNIDNNKIEVEVTIIFNNEQLRNHSNLDAPYKEIRLLLYKREKDVETFKIMIDNKDASKNHFIFKDIYSYLHGINHGLNEDDVHGDPKWMGEIKHPISHYFMDYQHPIVFVNTSNHAMAEHDANPRLWKWEYVPGIEDCPVTLGSMTRKQIDDYFDQVDAKKDPEFSPA